MRSVIFDVARRVDGGDVAGAKPAVGGNHCSSSSGVVDSAQPPTGRAPRARPSSCPSHGHFAAFVAVARTSKNGSGSRLLARSAYLSSSVAAPAPRSSHARTCPPARSPSCPSRDDVRRPRRSRPRISASGAAPPPTRPCACRHEVASVRARARAPAEMPSQIVGTPALKVTCSEWQRSSRLTASRCGPGSASFAPSRSAVNGSPQALT